MAGVDGKPKVFSSKRKTDSFDGSEECERATKRIDLSEGEKGVAAAVAEKSPQKMWRLPQEEVEWILAQSNEPVCAKFRELKRANPSLQPSPEEEKDEDTMLLYECVRQCYKDEEVYAKFQAWVRGEYARKGFVEIDYDYFGERAESKRLSAEARKEVFGGMDLSSDSDDDDFSKLLKRKIRSWI